MSFVTENRFGGLHIDDDDEEDQKKTTPKAKKPTAQKENQNPAKQQQQQPVKQQQQQQQQKPAATQQKPSQPAAPTQPTAQQNQSQGQTQNQRGVNSNQGPRDQRREQREPRDQTRDRPEGGNRRSQRNDEESYDSGKERTYRNNNESRQPRQGGRLPKHEFDRRSGTGMTDSQNKDKGWGKQIDQEPPVEEPKPETEATAAQSTPVSTTETPATDAKTEQVPESEDAKFLTLQEYKNKNVKAAVPLPEARKPGEGADQSQWKDAKVLTKEADEYFTGKSKPKAKSAQEKPKQKEVLDFTPKSLIGEHKRNNRERDDKDQQYQPKGKGNKGSKKNEAFSLDATAFPSLTPTKPAAAAQPTSN